MIALTIDCEEWNSPFLRGKKDKDNFNTYFSRIGNENLLKLLRKYDIKSTFFITGFFAEREKQHVISISKEGHEIASHGYIHFYRNNPNLNISKDIAMSKKILEKITRKKVIGFRAPQMQYSLKLLKILEKNKFLYDSSLNPCFLPPYYNNIKYPIKIHKPKGVNIYEIPTAVFPILRFPVNWIFFRNLGTTYLNLAVKLLEKKGIPAIIYIHSWEFYNIKTKTLPKLFTRNCGKPFLLMLEKFIKQNKKHKFVTLKELVT